MKIIAEIFEESYAVEFKKGELDGTRRRIPVETKVFDSTEKAILYFKEKYKYDSSSRVYLLWFGTIVIPRGLCSVGPNGYETATKELDDEFAKGKINLVQVEYQMTLANIIPITYKELKGNCMIDAHD